MSNFIITSITPWDFAMGNNAKDIAIELSASHQVLYVNPPLDRVTAWRESQKSEIQYRNNVIKGKEKSLQQISTTLWVLNPPIVLESINWIDNLYLFRFFNKMNNKRLSNAIKKALDTLDFDSFYLINDSDMFRSFHLNEFLNPLKYIYYSRDNLIAVDYWKKHGKVMEPELIASSSMAIANSVFLTQYLAKFNSNSHFVGQGCNLSLYSQGSAQVPAEIKNLKGPIIGYTGALFGLRLDISLLVNMAKTKSDWTFVLVGPEDEDFKSSELHQVPNVVFVGNKQIDELPNYISSFDVCINPQLINEVTIGNYPRKIDEYLAMGKPIVATKTIAMEMFETVCYLANGVDEYLKLISLAMAENSDHLAVERKAFASSHSWQNNVDNILLLLAENKY